jgi:hypothetical protein
VVDRRGGRPVWIGYSRGRDRRGACPVWIGYSTGSDRRGGGRPVGLMCSLSDTAPRAGGRRMRSPSTRPPHVPHPPHEGCTQDSGDSGNGEEEGAPGPAMTDEARSYLDLFFLHLSCELLLFVVIKLCIFVFNFLLFRIYNIRGNQLKK